MNRFKKELKKRGVKLENDYMYLPYEVDKNIFIDGVIVNSIKCIVSFYYNVDIVTIKYNRKMEKIDI